MTDDNGADPPEVVSGVPETEIADSDIPDDAFISPDEPIVRREREAVPDDAFISPDAPIVRTEEPIVGTVVGMSGSAGHASSLASIQLDAEQVAQVLEEASQRIREDGIRAGLKARPDASHFEVMLKAYLAGYFSTS
jgi:hypothetical protein